MKLLFDQNLSDRLVTAVASLFPDSTHVRSVGLERADDAEVWSFAKAHGFTIVSKDVDFHERSLLYGHPPKVICIRRSNCSTADISEILLLNVATIQHFDTDESIAVLILY